MLTKQRAALLSEFVLAADDFIQLRQFLFTLTLQLLLALSTFRNGLLQLADFLLVSADFPAYPQGISIKLLHALAVQRRLGG